jgi:hypothetical protein
MAEIAWRQDLARALDEARREGKPVFLDFWLRT